MWDDVTRDDFSCSYVCIYAFWDDDMSMWHWNLIFLNDKSKIFINKDLITFWSDKRFLITRD